MAFTEIQTTDLASACLYLKVMYIINWIIVWKKYEILIKLKVFDVNIFIILQTKLKAKQLGYKYKHQ